MRGQLQTPRLAEKGNSLIELYSDSYLAISYDKETLLLHANWKGYQSVESIQQGCERILESMVRYNAYWVLNDHTHVLGIWRFAAAWLANDWFPRMKQAGLRRFSWIYSPAKLSQVSTDATLALMNADAFGVKAFYDAAEALAWLRESPSQTKSVQQRRMRVIVIEDNRDFSQLFGDMLQIMGCDATVFSNARAGLEMAKKNLPDIIFCDLGLPGDMDGFAFARALRANKELAHIPLIAVSGYTSDEHKERAVHAGFDRVFPKPVKFADVSKALATFSKGIS
jgi:CheY-like chemotaxis protein